MPKDYSKLFPKRPIDAHKHSCGKVGIIAGSINMLGAAVLSARAALRSGAGLVYLLTIQESVPYINICYPELIVLPLPSTKGIISIKALPKIKEYIQEKKFTALAMGPGLTTEKSIKKIIPALLKFIYEQKIPTVLDADALNVLTSADFCDFTEPNFILTPHLEEFFRFYGQKPNSLLEKQDFASQLSEKIKQVIVLKGHETVIANGVTDSEINPTGNEGMATAGTGDVLTGIIAGLLAQGLASFDAAILGTYLHGLAGDLAKEDKTIYGLIASDLIDYLPKVFKLQKVR